MYVCIIIVQKELREQLHQVVKKNFPNSTHPAFANLTALEDVRFKKQLLQVDLAIVHTADASRNLGIYISRIQSTTGCGKVLLMRRPNESMELHESSCGVVTLVEPLNESLLAVKVGYVLALP
ncbi:MAG: hypothetical protein AAB515_02235 [Patescibacteria group bacterium]